VIGEHSVPAAASAAAFFCHAFLYLYLIPIKARRQGDAPIHDIDRREKAFRP